MRQLDEWLWFVGRTWEDKPDLEKNTIALIGVILCGFGIFQLWLGD